MTSRTGSDYSDACKVVIDEAERVCGPNAPQAQLVGHLAGEVVRQRAVIMSCKDHDNEFYAARSAPPAEQKAL